MKGEFVTTLRNQTCGTLAKIVVICGHINSPPLISKGTWMELGMLEIRVDGSLGKLNNTKILDETPSINIHVVPSSEETTKKCDSTSIDNSRTTSDTDGKTTRCSAKKTTSEAKHRKTSSKTMPSGETMSRTNKSTGFNKAITSGETTSGQMQEN